LQRSIRRVVPRDGVKLVALTFDLCEAAGEVSGYDAAVIDALRAERVAATLFAGGKWLRSHPERAMQVMADPLFEIGNHGWSHGNLRTLPAERAREEILWTQLQARLLRDQLVQRAIRAGVAPEEAARIPEAPALFRFPYGACRPETLALANAAGLAAIQWDVVSGDADPAFTPEMVAKEVLGRVKPGSIVVMHANGQGRGTAGALPVIIRGLRQKGYRFVTVSQLLAAGEPVAVDECYEIRPGDNQRYDAKASLKGTAPAKPTRPPADAAGSTDTGKTDAKPAAPAGNSGE
jgi:peptidoglycan/xylan/chitin deacetylase (PgdA/CDA1 family)